MPCLLPHGLQKSHDLVVVSAPLLIGTSLVAQWVKTLPAMSET